MISKIFLISCISLFLTSFAHSKVDASANMYQDTSSRIYNLKNSGDEELLILIDKQNEVIKKQNQVIDNLNKNYSQFKKEVDDHKIGQQYMNYPIWISILLGCATFVITALGVIVAVVSIFGYKQIKESAAKIASQKANDIATTTATDQVNVQLPQIAVKEITRLIDEGKFNQPLEDVIDMILRRENYQQGSSGFEKYPELDEE